MPTKLNRAGEQQNYVPAGNGDASGEYGNNATGSNKHFENFSKKKSFNNFGYQGSGEGIRIGLIYKMFKQGKIELTKGEINELWGFYENLSPRNTRDRKFIEGYKYLVGMLTGENPFDDGEIWDEEQKEKEFKQAVEIIKENAKSLTEGKYPKLY